MSQSSWVATQSLIERAAKVDPVLAADIRAFAAQRNYGLVFEHNRPERMRLYGKPVSKGDIVQVLPDRGKKESAESRASWCVTSIADGDAHLVSEDGTEELDAERSDLVAVADYDQPIYAGLRETGRVERGGDKPYHVVINGENYHALEALTFAYAGKVDCIYIDPPYNTGARDWKYNNDYVGGDDAYRHSKWLAMMERRLKLAKQLLNPSSSLLIVTIDEKEYLRLGLLLEQVFAGAKIQMVTSVINPKGNRRDDEFSRCEEYLFFLLLGDASIGSIGKTMLREDDGSAKPVRWKGLLRSASNNGRRVDRPNLFYPLVFKRESGAFLYAGDSVSLDFNRNDYTPGEELVAVWPIGENGQELTWSLSPETFRNYQANGYVRFGPWDGEKRVPYHLTSGQVRDVQKGEYEIDGRDSDGALILRNKGAGNIRPMTVWNQKSHSASESGTGTVKQLIPNRSFPFPKSLYAVEDCLRFFIANKPNALVLDFFAGSGTTAHAVMRLNHQDGGRRRSISVTNNEVSEDEAKKLTKRGLRQGDPEWEALGICQYVTKPRVEAAITGRTPEGEPIKGSYKFTDEFPMADGFEENAVFFDLTYQNPALVSLGGAFEEIAPLLWMRAGCRGEVIRHEERGYALAESYAVLFDYARARDFVAAVKARPSIGTAFVVTDDESRYSNIRAQLPDLDVCRLYESYLRSFRIAAEGAAI